MHIQLTDGKSNFLLQPGNNNYLKDVKTWVVGVDIRCRMSDVRCLICYRDFTSNISHLISMVRYTAPCVVALTSP